MVNTALSAWEKILNSALSDAAWDSSTKSAGYRAAFKKIAVPSTPYFGLVSASTLLFYNYLYPSDAFFYSGIISVFLTLFFFSLFLKRFLNFYYSGKHLNLKTITVTFIISLFTVLFLLNHISNITDTHSLPDSIQDFSGKVTAIGIKRDFSEITIEPFNDYGRLPYKVVLFNFGMTEISPGHIVFIHKTIHRVDIKNDAGSFRYYLAQGIFFVSSIDDNDFTIIDSGSTGIRHLLKKSLKDKIDNLFSAEQSGIIKALITADRSAVSKDATLHFRNAGALHLLAASGLHVGIAAAIPLFLIFFNLRRRTVLFLSLCMVIVYLILTDMPVSLVRASIMYGLFYIQLFLYRQPNTLNSLMLTASLIILSAPYEIFNLGFQLSFTATFGIILFYNLYAKSMNGFPLFLKKSISLTASAQVFTLPIIIYYLNQINTVSMLSNIIMIPLTAIFMYTSIISLVVTSVFSSTTGIALYITSLFYKLLMNSVIFFSDLNLNFYIYNDYYIILLIFSLMILPLIPSITNMKPFGAPLILSSVLCTLYFKLPAQNTCSNIVLYSGKSSVELKSDQFPYLMLDIYELNDIDILLNHILKLNTSIKRITLKNSSAANIIACKKISRHFIIDECCFLILPEFSSGFKNLLTSFETENIKIILPLN